MEQEIKEACGVFGIYNISGGDVAQQIYYGLSSLQHRGQESCGIAVSDTSGPMGNMNVERGMGLVSEVFKENVVASLKARPFLQSVGKICPARICETTIFFCACIIYSASSVL